MPYHYLTFSDLYEEQVRSSAPSSPVMGPASLSPVFLLPSQHASSSSHHHHHDRHHSIGHFQRRRRSDAHNRAMLKTATQDSDDVATPTSSSSSSASSSLLHMDLMKVFKRKPSLKSRKTADSVISTPASSRRSSFTSHGFASLNPVSAASSANTSPAISRQVSRQVTKLSDYDALVQRTAREEEQGEAIRQKELRAYFKQAADTGLSLRRF